VIDDHNGGTVSQNIVLTVNGANDNPIAAPDSNGTAKSSTLSISALNGVLAEDTDNSTLSIVVLNPGVS
jgi:hypothetical protein